MTRFQSILFGRAEWTGADDLVTDDAVIDLQLDRIRHAVLADYEDYHLDGFFTAPLRDVDAVRYRQEIFRDLDHSRILAATAAFTDGMRETRRRLDLAADLTHHYQQDRWHLDAAESYCAAVAALHDALTEAEPASRGFREFIDYLGEYLNGKDFRVLSQRISALSEEFAGIRYQVHMVGQQAQVERFAEQVDFTVDIEQTFARFRPPSPERRDVDTQSWSDMNHVDEQVLDAVAKLFSGPFSRLAEFRGTYRRFIDSTIATFDRELQFYRAYLGFVRRCTDAGLRFCYPEVGVDLDEIHADDAVDLALATTLIEADTPVVTNSFRLARPERILVVTGPNNGGKTTFARMVGQLAYLGALGCPVPGSRARLPLPDRIYSHFERQEHLATLRGKLDDELVRIRDILTGAGGHSVIIMNESFSSTTAADALIIATDVLRRIIALDAVAVFVTFLDELATLTDATVSMVGEASADDPARRTFHFTRRRADGLAYADAIAAKYGLTSAEISRSVAR